MPKSTIASVAAYLDALPPARRTVVAAVRDAVTRRLPKGSVEGIQYRMIGWFVPHAVFPAGYHCDPREPLPFVALGGGTSGVSLHLFCVYLDPVAKAAFVAAWTKSGKRLDMGAACVRFRALENVPLDVITAAIAGIPVAKHVATYEAMLAKSKAARPVKPVRRAKHGTKKPARKPSPKKG